MYGYKKKTKLSFSKTVEKLRAELAKEGFGVLTEIDVKGTLKKKLNVDFENYLILGACNPPFAYQALLAEHDIGLLLPCNVIVYEQGDDAFVTAIQPTVTMHAVQNPALDIIAKTIEQKLRHVVDAIAK